MANVLKRIKWKHYVSYIAIVLFLIVCLFADISTTNIYMFEKIGIAIILSVSLSFVVGFLGELSLGHAGFMCIGAYIGGKVASILVQQMDSLPAFLIALLVGGISASLIGIVIGLPTLRLKGDYLAIVTLAFGEIVRVLFLNSSKASFGGAFGLSTPRFPKETFFYVIFIVAIITIACFQNIIRSEHGRFITAIRDNEIAARASGVNVTKYKLIAFTMSAFFAGVAGVLFSYTQYTIQTDTFKYTYSIDILVMVVLGGMGSLNGSIFAAALITFINEKLSVVLTGNLAVLQKIVYALILVLVVIFSNAPGLRSFREKYNIGNFVKKLFRKKHDPSDINNDEGSWDRIPTKIKMDEMLSVDMKVSESVQDPDKSSDEKEGK